MTIAVTGSIAYDYLMTYPGYFRDHLLPDQLEKVSLSFLVDTLVRLRGGTAPNICYTLALLGDRPLLVGTVGEDFEEYRKILDECNIDTTFARVVPGKFSASFFANTDMSNAQICSFYTGAMAHASEIKLRELKPRPEMVFVSANDPKAMDMYVTECQELGIKLLYDPGQQVARSDPAELRRGAEAAYGLFVNEYEYHLIQKHTGLSEKDILSRVNFLVVTLAEKGAAIYEGDTKVLVDVVPPKRILDPTGVGDAFRGGFIRGYGLGLDWKTCGQMGTLAATYCLEQQGTQSHTYTTAEFVSRYRQYFDDQGALDGLLQSAKPEKPVHIS